MEAIMMQQHGSFDQSTSPYKSHLKYPKKDHPIISNPFRQSSFSSSGLLQPPPFLSQYSYPAPYSSPQPPLLPLPTATPRRSSKKGSNRRLREPNPLIMTSKKSSKSPQKEEKKSTESVVGIKIIDSREIDMFSSAVVFAISPPPSSLPLPSFSCCKAEAAGGVDAGATNDLRRLLRLHSVNRFGEKMESPYFVFVLIGFSCALW